MDWPIVITRTPNEKSEKGYTEYAEVRITCSEANEFTQIRAQIATLLKEKAEQKSTVKTLEEASVIVKKLIESRSKEVIDMNKSLSEKKVQVDRLTRRHEEITNRLFELEGLNERYLSALKILRDKPVEVTCNFPVFPETKTTWTPFVEGHGTIKEITQWAIGED